LSRKFKHYGTHEYGVPFRIRKGPNQRIGPACRWSSEHYEERAQRSAYGARSGRPGQTIAARAHRRRRRWVHRRSALSMHAAHFTGGCSPLVCIGRPTTLGARSESRCRLRSQSSCVVPVAAGAVIPAVLDFGRVAVELQPTRQPGFKFSWWPESWRPRSASHST
jgi:hypothetical protein